MADLKVSLFGTVQVALDGSPVNAPAYDKVHALLAYLAIESDRPHHRELLAELFWPDQLDGRGRQSLRQALTTLRQLLHDQDRDVPLLLATRDSVGINPAADFELDVRSFTSHVEAIENCGCDRERLCVVCVQNLDGALRQYRGEFLDGLTCDASPEFDHWTLEVREQLKLRALGAAHQLCEHVIASGSYLRAIELARFQIRLDPTREKAYRQLMLALYLNGDRTAALGQFELCALALDDELGVSPDEETVALRDAIRDGSLPVAQSRATTVRLPAYATPFIGRERELTEIQSLLAQQDCRLITLTGAGGTGKTRLAIEVASRAASTGRDDVIFVSLVGMRSTDELVSAIAGAVAPSALEHADPGTALLDYIRDRSLLLVLDNYEQMLPATGFVSSIVQTARSIRLIVTSRQRLDLYEEWVLDLEGLLQPDPADAEHLLETDSARLFLTSARRANSRLSLDEHEILAIGRICQLVTGIPLALELAAAWTPVLSCSMIVKEIETSLDFLASSFRNVPDRHRSMRAVFDRSWDLMTQDERAVFAKLSVFRDGFNREAAEQVAGASLGHLMGLVSKSLVRRTGDDRYELHELLRQYGEAKLWSASNDHDRTVELHSEYYCELLAEQEQALRGQGQEAAIHTLTIELENLRRAWRWAADHGRADLLLQAAHGIWIFLEVTSRYVDAEALFGLAVERMRDLWNENPRSEIVTLALASMLVRYGAVFVRLGDNQRGELLVDEGIGVARQIEAANVLGLGLNFQGMFAYERQDHLEAGRYLRESIDWFRVAGDLWGEAYSTNDLGMVTFNLGDISESERLLREAHTMFTRIGDKRGLAFALHHRGTVAAQLGRYSEARRLLQEALELRRSIRHTWAISMTLAQLGVVEHAAGNTSESVANLLLALQVARNLKSMPAVLNALTETAAVILAPHSTEQARRLLSAVCNHPAADALVRDRADRLLAEMGGDTVGVATGWDWRDDIEWFSHELLSQDSSIVVS